MARQVGEAIRSAQASTLKSRRLEVEDGLRRSRPRPLRHPNRICALFRRHRRAHDVPCDDGKELESSIDFRIGQRCSISGAVDQACVFFTRGSVIGGKSCMPRRTSIQYPNTYPFKHYGTSCRKRMSSSVKKPRQEIKGMLKKSSHEILYDAGSWRCHLSRTFAPRNDLFIRHDAQNSVIGCLFRRIGLCSSLAVPSRSSHFSRQPEDVRCPSARPHRVHGTAECRTGRATDRRR